MSTTALFNAPLYLWNLYVDHLWNYTPGSWVERTASTFRVLAFITIAPFLILTMLVRTDRPSVLVVAHIAHRTLCCRTSRRMSSRAR